MKLYFSPLACSLAARIALYEAGLDATFVEVDAKTKKAAGGEDFRAVTPLGLVPVLATDDGMRLSENAAILQYLAEERPEAGLAPDDRAGRALMRQWLSFVGTELHKAVFVPLLDESAPDDARSYALSRAPERLAYLAAHLEGREHLLDRFSVADAYLFAVLNWAIVTPVDLSPHRAIRAYQKRVGARPSVARAFSEERVLYARELARGAASKVWNAVVGR